MKFHETEILAKTSGTVYGLVKETIEMHPEDINREKGFEFSKARNLSTSLLRQSGTHGSGRSQKDRHRKEHSTKRTR
jgi:hypothetical protein